MEDHTSLIKDSVKPSDDRSSRNIEQANEEYPLEDNESNGQKLEKQSQ
jgi:hypothetical protein